MRENGPLRTRLAEIGVALALLTRLPMPPLPSGAFDRPSRAAWAFPLVGALVGVLAGVVGLAAFGLGLPGAAAAGLALTAQIALTGALHEDGLADTADGLWGGGAPARRLEIMRDSRIGTYGVLALVLSLGMRWLALAALLPAGIGALIAAAALSRGMLPALMTALPPARSDGLSRSVGAPGPGASAVAAGLGLLLALAAAGPAILVPALLAAVLVAALGRLARRRIGGQTGDILGAAQQLAEIALLLGLMSALGPA